MGKNREEHTSKSVTQEDVAAYAGVSRSLVSYVLNGGPRPVARETRDRILKAIEDLGYRPNKFAQKLMKSQYDMVAEKQFGIVMSDVFMLRRPYYADILAGIHITAHERNHHIRFIRFFQELKDPLLFNELIHKEEISGLMLIGLDQSLHTEDDERLLSQIQDRIANIICIEWEIEGLPSIGFNRQEAAYKAARYLLEKGFRDIIYIGPLDNRVIGFRQALFEEDMTDTLREPRYGSTLSDGFGVCRELIDQKRLPQAILGGTDEVSMGILSCLHERNIRVPDDISIVSIDNIEMAAFTTPPLTTVNVDTWEMGRLAVQTIIHRSKHPDQVATATLLPTKLILRGSCRS